MEFRPGSHSDFERLYEQEAPRLKRVLMPILGSAADAEDCVQETFVKAYRAWARWRPDVPAGAWIRRIAINTAISRRRREKVQSVAQRILGRRLEASADQAWAARDHDLARALRSIPVELALVVVLRHVYGYEVQEIAALLQVSDRTVRNRTTKAMDRLRRLVGSGAGISELPETELLRVKGEG